MRLAFRIVTFLAITATLLGGAGIAAYEITRSVWWVLGVIIALSLALSVLVDELLGIGAYFGGKKAERERSERSGIPSEAITALMRKHGLRPVSMHRVGGGPDDDEGDDDDDADDVRTQRLVSAHAAGLIDGDLKEAFFHLVHIMGHCPGSVEHAKRLQTVSDHLEIRLKTSPTPAMNEADRPTMH